MFIRKKRGWEIPERLATDEGVYLKRRSLLKGLGLGSVLAATGAGLSGCGEDAAQANTEAELIASAAEIEDPSAKLYPVKRNLRYTVKREITDPELATTYNNFYEFGSTRISTAPPGAADPPLDRDV